MHSQSNWKKKFAMIFSGQLFSILTSSMVMFSIIWHLTETTGSASVLMIAGLVGFMPQALLGPFIGVWLDRWNRKATMMIADGSIALSSLLLGAYFALGEPNLLFVYAVLLIRSTATAFHAPSFQAAIPLIAPADQLTRVAGWQQMVFSCSTIFGPALGIAVYSASSLEMVLFLDVIGALIANAMLLMVKIHQPKPETVQAPAFFRELKLGWETFVAVKPVVITTFATAVFGIVFMPLGMLFPLMTLQHFGLGGYSASLIEAVFSVGMVLGSLLLSVFAGKLKDTTFMSLSLILIGLTCAASGLLSSGAFAVFVVLSFLMGGGAPLFNGPYMAMIQKSFEPEKLGRVLSFVTSITMLSSPIGLALAGSIVEKYGVETWFFWAGVMVVFTGLFIYAQFRRKSMNEGPAGLPGA
ncbi:MFS transporter [Paenibacillus koleovorans]|uniref:MFS transporter n=1 Tax=Paenibacillus koleovorans TaxID=121608 RepID=UPI000FD6FFEC|nr:MFS transporter [Paenibacillus koleovorans]